MHRATCCLHKLNFTCRAPPVRFTRTAVRAATRPAWRRPHARQVKLTKHSTRRADRYFGSYSELRRRHRLIMVPPTGHYSRVRRLQAGCSCGPSACHPCACLLPRRCLVECFYSSTRQGPCAVTSYGVRTHRLGFRSWLLSRRSGCTTSATALVSSQRTILDLPRKAAGTQNKSGPKAREETRSLSPSRPSKRAGVGAAGNGHERVRALGARMARACCRPTASRCGDYANANTDAD
jgi:hypothetical protein